MKEAWISTAIQ